MLSPWITPAPTPLPLEGRDLSAVPLTTIFTPPDNCLAAQVTLEATESGQEPWGWWDWPQTSSSCYPFSSPAVQHSWSWYSPGVCPSGYDIAQSRVVLTQSISMTQAWCCPQSFKISSSTGDGREYLYCTVTSNDAAAITVENNVTQLTSLSSLVAYQWPLSVQWASSDLEQFTPASAPILIAQATTIYSLPSSAVVGATTSAAAATELPGLSTSDPHAGVPFSDETSSGLSTGEKAAVGVCAAVGAILGILAVAYYYRRKRRTRVVDTVQTPLSAHKADLPAMAFVGGELDAKERPMQELDASVSLPRHELDGEPYPVKSSDAK